MRKSGTSKITGDRAYTLSWTLRETIIATYVIAQREHYPQQWVINRLKLDVYDRQEFKRLPDYIRNELHTVDRSLSTYAISSQCFHAYLLDGQVVPSKGIVGSDLWQRFSQVEKETGRLPAGFVWNGTDKWYYGPNVH